MPRMRLNIAPAAPTRRGNTLLVLTAREGSGLPAAFHQTVTCNVVGTVMASTEVLAITSSLCTLAADADVARGSVDRALVGSCRGVACCDVHAVAGVDADVAGPPDKVAGLCLRGRDLAAGAELST